MKSLILAIALVPYASYGTVVTSATDEDDGSLGGGVGVSLREAVKYSPAGDTITFDAALSGQIIRLTRGEIAIAQSVTIDGSSLPARITFSGDKTGDGRTADDIRVFLIRSGPTVLESIIISGASGADGGGGINCGPSNVSLSIRNCGFLDNYASSIGGAIYSVGILTIRNTTFTGNSAPVEGGALRISNTVDIEGCTFSGNSSTAGGAIHNRGTTTVKNSAVFGNSASGYGGGIYNLQGSLTVRNCALSGNFSLISGGGIYGYLGSVIVENSTLFGNFGKSTGGGICTGAGSFTLKNATLSSNTAGTTGGGGIAAAGNVALDNSVVAGNFSPFSPTTPDISGTFTGTSNLTSGNPLLAPLGDYGGPTKTMPPLPGSPAINTGGTTTLTTDQRGCSRIGTPDIGAAEYQESADLARFWKLDFDSDGSPFGVEQALGTDPLISDSTISRNLASPTFDASGHAILTFGLASAPGHGTRWTLKRSPDLSPGSFTEIYRYDGSADTAAPGFGFLRTVSSVTVTDESPFTGGGFYRFEASLEP